MEEFEKVKDFFEILRKNLLKSLIYPVPCDILSMVLPVTVGGWPSLRGQLLLPPCFTKGGGASRSESNKTIASGNRSLIYVPNGYLFRSHSAWNSDCWYYRPVCPDKKEVIAGTLTSTAIISSSF